MHNINQYSKKQPSFLMHGVATQLCFFCIPIKYLIQNVLNLIIWHFDIFKSTAAVCALLWKDPTFSVKKYNSLVYQNIKYFFPIFSDQVYSYLDRISVRNERWDVPESTTAVPVDLRDLVAEKSHKGRDPTKLPRLRLHGVVHVAEVLEVGRRVGLDHRVGVLQELDHLVEVGVPPLHWSVSHSSHP